MTDQEARQARFVAALHRMGTDVFDLPDDERTGAGAREMADLLTRIAGLEVDSTVRPEIQEPGEKK